MIWFAKDLTIKLHHSNLNCTHKKKKSINWFVLSIRTGALALRDINRSRLEREHSLLLKKKNALHLPWIQSCLLLERMNKPEEAKDPQLSLLLAYLYAWGLRLEHLLSQLKSFLLVWGWAVGDSAHSLGLFAPSPLGLVLLSSSKWCSNA